MIPLIEISVFTLLFLTVFIFKITSVVFQLVLSMLGSLFSVSMPCQNIYQNYHYSERHCKYKNPHLLHIFAFQQHIKQSRKACRGGIGCLKQWVPSFNTSAPKYDQWLQKTNRCLFLEYFKCICDNCKGCHWTSYFLCK